MTSGELNYTPLLIYSTIKPRKKQTNEAVEIIRVEVVESKMVEEEEKYYW